ncbi:MAG TPA: MBL fold metallo-hydrolase [Acidimicrobiales bacterium]|nr:MBL fold metallo-hydrolase [Acidimicrobiales bacterium]
MFFRQYQLGCLSLFSYMVGDTTTGRAVVVDPQRDVSGYLADAEANGLRIERVIETNFHADFLSGHLELAAATGAAISYGEGAQAEFPVDVLAHGTRLPLGEVVLEVRATPGHTPESISVVVYEHGPDDKPWGVLTGDCLFIGDVGRPDLLASAGWTPEELARRLYRSLHDQLLTLPDSTRLYPAHGAGSACGKAMSTASESTIGEQRATNYALQPMSEDDFVKAVTEGQVLSPAYFPFAADRNRRAHPLLDDHQPPVPLTLDEAVRWQQEGAVVVDTRPADVFASGHLRRAVNVGLDGRFAEYAGDVIRPGHPVVLACEPGTETEARVRLARIGFDNVVGALVDVAAVLWDHPELVATSTRLAATDLGRWRSDDPGLQLVDVRNPGEQEAGMIAGAVALPLARLVDGMAALDPSATTVVYCAGGYRSSVAASALEAAGFGRVADILGGYAAWQAAGLATERPPATTAP